MTASFLSWQGQALQSAKSFPAMAPAQSVAFVDPEYFQVVSPLNPHMLDSTGQLNRIDPLKARQQWQRLLEVYQDLGFVIHVLKPEPNCPDMVFCANQSLPYIDTNGRTSVLMSHMASDSRHQEVESIASQLESLNYQIARLPISRSPESIFEGTGDALWVPGRRLLLGGYGFRTSADVYRLISEQIGVSIALFELRNPRFYHLDTCLSILDDTTVLASREGFTEHGWAQLQQVFERVIAIPLHEADSPGFAGNAHCPDGKHVIIQEGNRQTEAALREAGYVPVAVDTSEFIKSGGSVFCMKLMLF